MAERNIMLTFSAFFVYFTFQRLVFNIRKLANEEHLIENPGAKSVVEDDGIPLIQHAKHD
jgi:hypothetical protein